MKRGMVGGAHRGPVGAGRQRRTIRIVQGLLIGAAAGLLMFAGHSLGRSSSVSSDDLTPPRRPGAGQTIVLVVLGLGTLGAALALQGGEVRLPTPKRLRDLEDAGALGPVPLPDDVSQERSAMSPEQTG